MPSFSTLLVAAAAGSSVSVSSSLATVIPSVTIAPGVDLPMVSLGTGSGQHGDVANATYLWIKAGGTAIDTAYDYRDEPDIARGLAEAGVKPSDVYV
jgi:2,5-diketo-D-gluconate reductase A